jgi:hypothetical protein
MLRRCKERRRNVSRLWWRQVSRVHTGEDLPREPRLPIGRLLCFQVRTRWNDPNPVHVARRLSRCSNCASYITAAVQGCCCRGIPHNNGHGDGHSDGIGRTAAKYDGLQQRFCYASGRITIAPAREPRSNDAVW